MYHVTTSNSAPSENSAENEVLIKVENLGKVFCRDLKKSLWYALKDTGTDILLTKKRGTKNEDLGASRVLRDGEFRANEGISFELRRGECLGLIGHNGAGKTTLLKMLNGLIKPDEGKITIYGRVGALIALGAGFNPILTGRENVYISASIYGLTKAEVDQKYDEIIEFAELEDFMDTPLQSYSSGMQVRLGFAIASAIKPDVLLLDEVLAVGDRTFQTKCLIKISEMLSTSAVIFVSHQLPNIERLTDKCLWLKNGTIEQYGCSKEVLADYISESNYTLLKNKRTNDHNIIHCEYGEKLEVDLSTYFTEKEINCDGCIVGFRDSTGDLVAQSFVNFPELLRPEKVKFIVKELYLRNEVYSITINLTRNNFKNIVSRYDDAQYLVVSGSYMGSSHVQIKGGIFNDSK